MRQLVVPMLTCGYCAFGGNHHQCPGGVRNGNGSIAVCACKEPGCRAGTPRCTDCNNREPGTVGSDWRCLDKNDCLATQEKSALKNPTYLRVREVREAYGKHAEYSDGTEAPEPTKSRSRGPREAGKPCTCGCGETTGGGRFKPGHDSKYLNQLTAAADDQARGLAYGISEAFGKKYDKRVGVASVG